jgi:tripartite-type tricarboxylate transporter receptor subunit TctC
MRWIVAVLLGLFTVSAVTPSAAIADVWPSKPIRIIVSFTPGSATDIIARLVFQEVSAQIGQSIIIENRGGAGGTIGTAAVAKSAPDGYTMLVNAAGHAAAPWVYPNLTYDTAKDLSGVTPLANVPNALVVAPNGKFATVADIIAAARARPGTITYASAGTGTASHLNAERFRLTAKFEGVHVPFRGAPEALTEIMAERLDFFWVPVTPALSAIREGKLKALAVSTTNRASALPDVPTTLELGLPESDYNFWIGLFVPSKTPREIVQRIHSEVSKAVQAPSVKARIGSLGAEAMLMSPEQFDTYVKRDIASNEALVKAAGVTEK